MHRRTRRTLLIVAGVLLLLAVAIFLRSKAPPEAARLLPESDGIIYINFKPFRVFLHKELKPPQRVPEYQQFVDATGIDWERDLDQVAVALHRMPDPNGPNGPVAYSLVLVGKLTGKRLNAWLDAHATSRETYAGNTIYNIPSRAAPCAWRRSAMTCWPSPTRPRPSRSTPSSTAIAPRHCPLPAPRCLSHHYHEVPLLSLAWGVGQIGLPFSESGAIKIFGLSLPLEDGATIVASVTPSLPLAGSLRLRVEEIAPTDQEAASQAAALNTLVAMARGFTAPLPSNPANNGLKQLLKTAEVTQKRDRVVVTATLSPSLV